MAQQHWNKGDITKSYANQQTTLRWYHSTKHSWADLIKESDVEWKPKLILQANPFRQLLAELLGSGRRVSEQRFCIAVHKRDRQHQRLLRLGRLQFKPAWRLISCTIDKCPPQPFLTVRCIARWTFFDEASQIADKLQQRTVH